MSSIYVFCAAVGVPLVVWLLVGGHHGSDHGDVGHGNADHGDGGAGDGTHGWSHGIGAFMVRALPLNTLAIAAAVFGTVGWTLTTLEAGSATTLAAAAIAAVGAGSANSVAFAYLRRSESDSALRDADVVGSMGKVVIPTGPGRRGRVAVVVGGQQMYLTAVAVEDARDDRSDPATIEIGEPVLVVDLKDGTAHVVRLDPQLR